MKNLQLGTYPVDKILATDGKTEINSHEKHLIHYTFEYKSFDSLTGERLSNPVPGKKYVDDFVKMSQTEVIKNPDGTEKYPENAFRGAEVIIQHDPRRMKKETAIEVAAKEFGKLSEEEQLRVIYKQLYKEDSDPADNVVQLRALIEEKKAVIEAEKEIKPKVVAAKK